MKKLLSSKDHAPFKTINKNGKAKCLIVCDHASNKIPGTLKNLGVSKKDLQKHIAWDPGTAEIGRYLSVALDAPAVLASYSRLVADLNRGAKTKECMLEVSDHILIPGNKNLSTDARRARVREIFTPYHREISRLLKKWAAKKQVPVLLSIHSFTPKMDGKRRPWQVGVLWNKDDRLSRRVIKNLRRDNPGLLIGANEPYSLKALNLSENTVGTHAEKKGLPCLVVEFRQDLVSTPLKAQKWAKILLRSLLPVLEDPKTYTKHNK